jgi:hypothetical protein
MKKKKLSYLIASLLLGLSIFSITFYSCEKENIVPNTSTDNSESYRSKSEMPDLSKICGSVKELNLLGENGEVVGTTLIFNDTKYFYVQFRCNGKYILGDAAMHISPTTDQFPMDLNGNPLISKFDFKIKGQPLSNVRAIIVPISKLYGQSYVAASVQARSYRSDAKQSFFITAWADGRSFGNSVKGKMFLYKRNACTEANGTFIQNESSN